MSGPKLFEFRIIWVCGLHNVQNRKHLHIRIVSVFYRMVLLEVRTGLGPPDTIVEAPELVAARV